MGAMDANTGSVRIDKSGFLSILKSGKKGGLKGLFGFEDKD